MVPGYKTCKTQLTCGVPCGPIAKAHVFCAARQQSVARSKMSPCCCTCGVLSIPVPTHFFFAPSNVPLCRERPPAQDPTSCSRFCSPVPACILQNDWGCCYLLLGCKAGLIRKTHIYIYILYRYKKIDRPRHTKTSVSEQRNPEFLELLEQLSIGMGGVHNERERSEFFFSQTFCDCMSHCRLSHGTHSWFHWWSHPIWG